MVKIRHLAVFTNGRNQRMVEIQYFVIHRGRSHAGMSLLLNKNDVKHIPAGAKVPEVLWWESSCKCT